MHVAVEIPGIPRRGVFQQHRKLAARRDVQFAADLPHAFDEGDHPAHFRLRLRVGNDPGGAREFAAHDGLARNPGAHAHALPNLLTDERCDRMQRAQQHLQAVDQGMARAAFRRRTGGFRLQHGLGEFQVPIAELMPGKFVQGVGDVIEAVVGESGFHAREHGGEPRLNPAVGQAEFRAIHAQILIVDVHQHIARRIPQLVAEVAILLDPAHVEAQIAALRGEPRKTQAQGIRAECRDALRKLLARSPLDRGFHLRLHQAAGALGEQGVE